MVVHQSRRQKKGAKGYMTTKEYLEQIYFIDMEMISKFEILRKLESKAEAGKYIDETTDSIIEVKKQIKADIYNEINQIHRLYNMILKVENSKYRKVLFDKYINLHTLEHIAKDMNYSYMQVCRYHGKALQEIEKIQEQDNNQTFF